MVRICLDSQRILATLRNKYAGFDGLFYLDICYSKAILSTTELSQIDNRKLRCLMDLNQPISAIAERRGKPRMKCSYSAMVRGCSLDGKKFEENATVLNLSAGGVYMLINRFINKGQDLSVKIAFPTGSLEWGSSKLATNGVVVRTEALSEEVLGIAIKFQRRRFL